MRLTVLTDYSLRALMYLAAQPQRLATIPEIAAAYGISQNHMMKVVNGLARTGFIETVRGRGGGMRLGAPAAEISVGAVVRAVEPDFDMVECFSETGTCRIGDVCVLHSALERALAAYLAELDKVSLADLVVRPQALLLALSPGAAPNAE